VPSTNPVVRLQQLLDQATDVCRFPGGVIDLPEHTRLIIPRSMRIDGNNTTLRVAGVAVPANSLLDADALPNGSRLEIRDLTIIGPDTTSWDPNTESIKGAISYQLYKTWLSTLIVRNVTISGGYGSGVLRAGGGQFEVKNCTLGAWVDGVAFFESHGGYGTLVLSDTELRAPANSKYSSIGVYIHPHLHLSAERVTGSNWNRFLIYLNGSMQSAGNHDLIEVAATNCALIQTGSSSVTTLMRCTETGTVRNGGSYFKGPVTSVGSRWASNGIIGFMNNNAVDRRFVGDIIQTTSLWLAAGNQTSGTVSALGCSFALAGRAAAIKLVSTSTVTATLTGCQFPITTSTSAPLAAEGGTIALVATPMPPNSRAVAPGRLLSA
jgi:hypothetical protein